MTEAAQKWLRAYDNASWPINSYTSVAAGHLRRMLVENERLEREIRVLRVNMSRSILRRLDTQLGKQGGNDERP